MFSGAVCCRIPLNYWFDFHETWWKCVACSQGISEKICSRCGFTNLVSLSLTFQDATFGLLVLRVSPSVPFSFPDLVLSQNAAIDCCFFPNEWTRSVRHWSGDNVAFNVPSVHQLLFAYSVLMCTRDVLWIWIGNVCSICSAINRIRILKENDCSSHVRIEP